jgi:hypothetical protein
MDLNELLIKKLKEDIRDKLLQEYKKNNLVSTTYTYDIYKKIINDKINLKIINTYFTDKKIVKKNNDNQCCARVWNYHKGTQCSYKKNNGDYCIHHKRLIEQKGYLPFKRYDEPRPNFNEKGNQLRWHNHTSFEMLEIIIKYQNLQLINLIN